MQVPIVERHPINVTINNINNVNIFNSNMIYINHFYELHGIYIFSWTAS